MFSDVVKSALEKEIAGQDRAVNSVVRGVTRAVGGLVPREGALSTHMFMGPTGTGKTHLVRSLARFLHGSESNLVIADCTQFAHADPWTTFVEQLAPLFTTPRMDSKWAVLESPPLSVILIEYLERARPEVIKTLAGSLETGQIRLPEGRQGSLRNCLVFITSALCDSEILDETPRIGFSGSQDEEDEAPVQEASDAERLYTICRAAAQETFGANLMGRMDALVIFHRMREEHLTAILDRLMEGLNTWLAPRGFRCEMEAAAKTFLLERAGRDMRLGCRELVRVHRRFLEFPVADLAVSGRIPAGGVVVVDCKPDARHLHFTITRPTEGHRPRDGNGHLETIPVRYEDGDPVSWIVG